MIVLVIAKWITLTNQNECRVIAAFYLQWGKKKEKNAET